MLGTIEWFPRLRLFSLLSKGVFFPNDQSCVTSYFSVLPGIAFSLDLIETTGRYGVAEVLLSSAMAAGVFSVFGGQPLCIAGVTGMCLGARALVSLRYSPSGHRSYYRLEQNNLRHSGKGFGCSGLLAVYGMGIPLGCNIPLDIGSAKL